MGYLVLNVSFTGGKRNLFKAKCVILALIGEYAILNQAVRIFYFN
jgi:hypothetical protein